MVAKRIIQLAAVLLCLGVSLETNAQIKVLEKSSKKPPAWLVSVGDDYFVSSNMGATLEQAQMLCLEDIKKQIISAVAENIKSESSQNTTQITNQSEIVEFNEEFLAKFETRSAVLPFINGISLSKAEAFYYEKTLDKSTKQERYSYSVLYPFSQSELNMLIRKFNEQDAQMEAELDALIEGMDVIESTEQIDAGLAKVEPLLNYFFDDVRIAKAQQTQAAYKKLYSMISLELVSSQPSEMVYVLMLDGSPISTQAKPQIRSNSATEIMYNSAPEKMVIVSYDDTGCIDGEENWIEVGYRLAYTPLKKKFYPVMTTTPMNVRGVGEMTIMANKADSSGVVNGVTLIFQLDNKSREDVILKGITLRVNEFSTPLNDNDLSIALTGGVVSLEIPYTKPLSVANSGSFSKITQLSFTKGHITLQNQNTGATESVPLVVKYTFNQN